MIVIKRQRPEPEPVVRPVFDSEASPAIRTIYAEMTAALQVPWVAMITRGYARYPRFFSTLWSGMREVCASEAYFRGAEELMNKVDEGAAALPPTPVIQKMRELGYTDDDIQDIRSVVDILSHGNNIYQPLVMAALVLLEGAELSGDARVPAAFRGRHAPEMRAPFVFVEAHHAAAETRALYDEIAKTLGLPYINTDYRVLARWPSFLPLAWEALKPNIGTPVWLELVEAYFQRSVSIAHALPNQGQLTPDILRRAAEKDAPLDEVLAVVRLLNNNIPPLLVNMAFLRRQLYAGGT